MVRWWWFGPSVTKPQLTHDLNAMRDGGFGGVEVQPTFPLGPRRTTRRCNQSKISLAGIFRRFEIRRRLKTKSLVCE